MDMSLGSESSSLTPLNDSGVDFSNFTQAYNFQQEILDDTILQVIANSYARYFWYGVVVLIGLATIFNIFTKILLQIRIRAAAANRSHPASATSQFTKFIGGVTAVLREATYPQFSPTSTCLWLKFPTFGIIILLLIYLGFILALEFQGNDIAGAQYYTALGVRASWLAVAQIPLLLLLSGKANLIGALVGTSYERLNVLHRWVARMILLLVTLHFGYQSYGWNEYGLMQLEWNTDTCPPTGIAAYALLLWLNITALAPIRNRFYEIWVVQHILSFIAFIYLVVAHLPSTAYYSRVYVYAGVGIYFLDRLIRTIRYTYNNIRPGKASLMALEGGVTKIRVQSKQIKSWTPGSHVLLSIPRLGFGQSHPATIASIPSSNSGELIFILKGRKGFTNRLLKSASSPQTLILENEESEPSSAAYSDKTYIALIGGPYGGSHSDPAAFDTVLLISGSTGITFVLPNLLSLAHRSQAVSKLPLRLVEFVWVVKQVCLTSWVANELSTAVSDLKAKGINIKVTIHVTCDDSFTGPPAGTATSECSCDLSLGPCCCSAVIAGTHMIGAKEELDATDDIIISQTGASEGDAKAEKTNFIAATAISQTSNVLATQGHKNLPFATFVLGRPDMKELVWELADQAEGEMGVFACGPLGLSTGIRNSVARVSDDRAVHKGTGAEGIYLHVESFC